jgi:PIN domain nuclease of toxin-antitoxin system
VIDMVLDSSALLILLRGEAGHERVAKSLEVSTCMTSVSLTVVLAALPNANARGVLEDVGRLGIEVISVDSITAIEAARFHAPSKSFELMFALALAKVRGLELLTGILRTELTPNSSVKIHSLR